MFYFIFVHSKVILDYLPPQKQKTKQKTHIFVSYTNLPTGLWTISLTAEVITPALDVNGISYILASIKVMHMFLKYMSDDKVQSEVADGC